MCASSHFYSRDTTCRRSITLGSLHVFGLYCSKDDPFLVIKWDLRRNSFSLEAITRGNLRLMLGLLCEKKHENSEINCIS